MNSCSSGWRGEGDSVSPDSRLSPRTDELSPQANIPMNLVRPSMAKARTTAGRGTNFHSIADLVSSTPSKENLRTGNEETRPRTQEDYIDVLYTPPPSREVSTPPTRCDSQAHSFVTPEGRTVSPDGSTAEVADKSGSSSPTSSTRDDGPDSRARKGRTIYKAQQVYVLEQVFSRTHYPDPEVIETLARDLEISENKIKVWFQNKRARWRRRAAEAGHSLTGLGVGAHGLAAWPHPTATGQSLVVPQPVYPSSLPPLPLAPGMPMPSLSPFPFYPGVEPSVRAAVKSAYPGYTMPLSLMHIWSDMAKLNAT